MFFKLPTPDAIRKRQIEEAQRAALEHAAAAEHHGALAEMYRGRIARLTPPGNFAWPEATQNNKDDEATDGIR